MSPIDVPEPRALRPEPLPPVAGPQGVDPLDAPTPHLGPEADTLPPAPARGAPTVADPELQRRHADRQVALGLVGGAALVLLVGGMLALRPAMPAVSTEALSTAAHLGIGALSDRLGWTEADEIEDVSLASALAPTTEGRWLPSVEEPLAIPATHTPEPGTDWVPEAPDGMFPEGDIGLR